MLGHIKPPLCQLSYQDRVSYQTVYCSLCDALRKQCGFWGSWLINHELTFVLLAFSPYKKNDMLVDSQTRCPARLWLSRKPVDHSELIEQAAIYCLILAWLKITDWATDQPARYRTFLQQKLSIKIHPYLQSLPSKTFKLVGHYHTLVTQPKIDFAFLKHMSGRLAAHFVTQLGQQAGVSDQVLQSYRPLFTGIGELILETDHLLDFLEDGRRGQYNPIWVRIHTAPCSIQEAYIDFWCATQSQIRMLQKKLISLGSLVPPTFVRTLMFSLNSLIKRLERARLSVLRNHSPEQQEQEIPTIENNTDHVSLPEGSKEPCNRHKGSEKCCCSNTDGKHSCCGTKKDDKKNQHGRSPCCDCCDCGCCDLCCDSPTNLCRIMLNSSSRESCPSNCPSSCDCPCSCDCDCPCDCPCDCSP